MPAPGPLIRLPFPTKGLSEIVGYSDQPPETSADLQNVLAFEMTTGRSRGGQRPGIAKQVSGQIAGDASVQEIVHTIGPNFGAATGANQFVIGNPTSEGFALHDEDGAEYATGGSSGWVYECSCWDAEGNVYIAMRNGATSAFETITKRTVDGTEVWSITVNHGAGGGSSRIVQGMAVLGNRLFIFFDATGDYNDAIYRYYASTGAAIDASYWVKKSEATLSGSAPTTQYQNYLAASGGYLGVLMTNTGPKVQFDVLNPETGLQVSATDIISGASGDSVYCYAIVGDGFGNFILSYAHHDDSAVDWIAYLDKRDKDGTQAWVTTSSDVATQDDYVKDMAYDFANNTLVCVGPDVMGSGFSAAIYGNTDGVQDSALDPDSVTSWDRVLVDADASPILIQNASGNNVKKFNTAMSTVTWSLDTETDDQDQPLSVNTVNTVNPSAFRERAVRTLVVAGGTVKRIDTGSVVEVSNGTDAFDATRPVVYGSSYYPDIYFADGVNTKKYQSSNNSVVSWTASAGSFPVDNDGRYPRLITVWQSRVVMSGLIGDPQNWFMTAMTDPSDFDYSPATTCETMAVAGNTSDASELQDVINALMPYDNDYLLFGCDHSISQMTGNPAAGGRFDTLSDVTGVAWGRAFTQTPDRAIWFMGSRGGLYRIEAGQRMPQRIAETTIDERLSVLQLGDVVVRLAYSDRMQGLLLTVTPLDITSAATHYWFDMRNKAWFPWVFANTDHNPKVIHLYDGDDPDDRTILMGGWDGYVRKLDIDGTTYNDDGTAIDSYVMVGPIQDSNFLAIMLQELSGILGASSSNVTYTVHLGESAEEALTAGAMLTGTLQSGRNVKDRTRLHGHSFFVKLRNNTAGESWTMEVINARISQLSQKFSREF